ncbi:MULTISPECIES: DUF1203 domain-containing protein [unclassified Microbulbifer]|uniref:DUF1203 domain-containing protein n=1 Tax=unclassified Microbulbifer TaxID=2619833 RepID=UPI0027E4B798|nr:MULTISPECIES: DUF1203 domain-containing protein [unclassified Microbulbifer]
MAMPFIVTPIREEFLSEVRQTGLDDQNQPVRYRVADGGEPCRDVLRRARPGERIVLASYCPFRRPGPYREYGPVFVLAQPEENQNAKRHLPLPSGEAGDYLKANTPVVLRAYCAEESIVAARLVLPEQIETELVTFFARSETEFVLLRFAAYGCYALRFDRVPGPKETTAPEKDFC